MTYSELKRWKLVGNNLFYMMDVLRFNAHRIDLDPKRIFGHWGAHKSHKAKIFEYRMRLYRERC